MKTLLFLLLSAVQLLGAARPLALPVNVPTVPTNRPGNIKITPIVITASTNPLFHGSPVIVVKPRPPAPPPQPVTNTPILVRYGNFICPGFPTHPPVFTEADLIGRNTNMVDHARSIVAKATGDYVFKPRNGARQFIWFADTIATGHTFTVSGFPFAMYPDSNKAYMSVKIAGVSGKVFISADINTGGFTLTVK